MIGQYFMTNNNYKLIMSVLYEYFQKKQYNIGEQEENLCYEIMEFYLSSTKQNNKESLKNYLQRLNKLVLNKMINVIDNHIEKEKNEKKINIDKKDMANVYEELIKERNSKITKEDEKEIQNKIKEEVKEDNSQISNQFEKLNQNREKEQKVIETQLNSEIVDYKIINNRAPKTEGQRVLIEQPKKFKELIEDSFKSESEYIKTDTIVIDSRDRDTIIYTSNSNYQIDLDEEYKNILSVELVSIDIPKTQYLINITNNLLYFNTDGQDYIATVPIGNYTIDELLVALKSSMDTISGSTFTLSKSSLTNKITISISTSTFDLQFVDKTNQIGKLLGFIITSNLEDLSTITSPNQYNLNGPTYIILHINEFENLFGKKSSVKKAFAKIPLDATHTEYKYFKNTQDYHVIKDFSPPLAKLAQLNIRFLNYEGEEYDFGGLEHSMILKIRRLNQSLGYFTN
jgi:hypothetical protein